MPYVNHGPGAYLDDGVRSQWVSHMQFVHQSLLLHDTQAAEVGRKCEELGHRGIAQQWLRGLKELQYTDNVGLKSFAHSRCRRRQDRSDLSTSARIGNDRIDA